METSWKPYHKTALNQPFIYLKYSHILQDNLQLGGGLYLESQPRVSRPSLGNANSCITITKRLASNVLFCSGYHGYRDKVEDGICLRPEGKKNHYTTVTPVCTVQASQAAFSPLSLNPSLGHYGHSYQDLMFDTPILSPSPPTRTVPKNTFLHVTAKGRWSYLIFHAMDCWNEFARILKVFFEQCWNYSLCKVIS